MNGEFLFDLAPIWRPVPLLKRLNSKVGHFLNALDVIIRFDELNKLHRQEKSTKITPKRTNLIICLQARQHAAKLVVISYYKLATISLIGARTLLIEPVRCANYIQKAANEEVQVVHALL